MLIVEINEPLVILSIVSKRGEMDCDRERLRALYLAIGFGSAMFHAIFIDVFIDAITIKELTDHPPL